MRVFFFFSVLSVYFLFFRFVSYQAAVSADNTHWPMQMHDADETRIVSRIRFRVRDFQFGFAFRASSRIASD